jgi:hypothetical protein
MTRADDAVDVETDGKSVDEVVAIVRTLLERVDGSAAAQDARTKAGS